MWRSFPPKTPASRRAPDETPGGRRNHRSGGSQYFGGVRGQKPGCCDPPGRCGGAFRRRRLPPGEPQMKRQEVGEITVVAVASISAVCEAKNPAVAILLGDVAELSAEDACLPASPR